MSENSAVSPHPKTGPTESHSLPRGSSGESRVVSRDQYPPTSKPPNVLREERAERGDRALPGSIPRPSNRQERTIEGKRTESTRAEEINRLRWRNTELEGVPGRVRVNAATLMENERANAANQMEREWASMARQMEGLILQSQSKDYRIAELESKVRKVLGDYDVAVRYTRTLEERLKKTESLSAARSAELSESRAFLSTTDRIPEEEVLGIVRDLNENIFQFAVRLTDEWWKLEPSQAADQMEVDPTLIPRSTVLIQLVRDRDQGCLTLQIQSSLCSQVEMTTSSWRHHKEWNLLESIYQQLSASEGQAISARWRSLTHSNLPNSPPRSELLVEALVEELAKVLRETGSFSSTQESLDFVRTRGLEAIKQIVRLSLRLELAFMVEVTSSDMALLFVAPGTVFDGAKMTRDGDSGGAPTPGGRDKVACTTEVGVGKSVCAGPGESRRAEILLKTTVVLEEDLTGGK